MKVYDRTLTPAETGHTQDVQKLGSGTGKSANRGADTPGDRVEFSGNLGRLSRTLSTYDTGRAARVHHSQHSIKPGLTNRIPPLPAGA